MTFEMADIRFADLMPEIPLIDADCPEIHAHGIAGAETYGSEFCTIYFRYRRGEEPGTVLRWPVARVFRPTASLLNPSGRLAGLLAGPRLVLPHSARAH